MLTFPELFSAHTALYSLFIMATLALWTPLKRPLVPLLGLGILILGFAIGAYNWIGIAQIIALLWLVATIETTRRIWLKWLSISAALALAAGLATHQLPGIWNLPVIQSFFLTPESHPFTMYWNFDKAWLSLLLLFPLPLYSTRVSGKIGPILVRGLTAVFLLAGFASVFGYIQYEPKVPVFFWPWVLNNILMVCVSEEALFRGFLQRHLCRVLPATGAICVSAVLFGAAHAGGGVQYVLFATLAGLFYGYQYHTTNRIETAILTHFVVNLAHILFFTYPALQNGTPPLLP